VSEKNKLYILWTNGSPVTFKNMVSMYAYNSLKNNWWEEITLIIWGETAQLTAENKEIQEHITKLMEAGVHVSACKACAEELEAADTLNDLGIEVKYWGEPLTEVIKGKENMITI
jgi:hypothetical protein